MTPLLVLLLLALVGYFVLRMGSRALVRSVTDSPEYRAELARIEAAYAAERTVMEQAPWIGRTGLDESLERELPKYLRREFGESLLDDSSLKAKDLDYLGAFNEDGQQVHYWRIPTSDGEPTFAYIEVASNGETTTGWGDRQPPAADRS
jgi:hypothetical protein